MWGREVEKVVEPVHAYGFFSVSRDLEFNQIVVFEYIDVNRYYASLSESVEKLDAELSGLAANMQRFLDQEEVVINGERVRPRVVGVNLGFRGEPEEPYLIFFIYFRGKPRRGINYYENLYEAEISEYPYEVYWVFPPNSRVEEVECSGTSELIGDNIVIIRVKEGERIAGYEKIVFRLE
ncbi:MAG: hypothetical protein DRJ96_08455 [Thermoprotei archaeon]|nr:hypothetical protein [Thermoproteales archaeon]RLE85136.1 MAG: hypothetical protein DRJ67_09370 [Thermoprotei archaeon]RLE95519.1 MAG: hypothetical protein DRJ96_08455 [Thermoprotei archaeon]RLE98174.1 MAG: hypothetical protein DRJ57_03820 [Thermoprotei archaeon]